MLFAVVKRKIFCGPDRGILKWKEEFVQPKEQSSVVRKKEFKQ